ncbi:TonB-dependent receptor plug domain-containing protein [Mangrovibacterium sp.]|uniref:TonB-dependent receptor plug domain-containing protein n=1 Tax=Mangrovibacterium sp. TaxID=1961364 RepID=UPI00356AE7E0
MKNILKILFSFLPGFFLNTQVAGQENKVYSNMSLDELLNIEVVVTASKQPEDLFEAPLSVTIINKDEINKSGATSIPEALRLSPGLIVREITPGNYDVQIRGYDDITKNIYIPLPYNTTTLVMIDNRIVYSYFSGGTFWESFPIDINDIERIEVVRGPASALYGPNAVSGVINIITSHSNNKGLNASVNGTAGTQNAKNATANIGYNWNDRTKISFSGNFTERYRYNELYFDFNKKGYFPIDQLEMFINPIKDETTKDPWSFEDYQEEVGAYYDSDLSLRKIGGNLFLNHNFSEQTSIDIALGAQKSQSQKIGFINMVTPISQNESKSFYFDTRLKYKNFNGQFNINSGHDYSNYSFNSYKFTNTEASLEYHKQFGKVRVRPGLNYKHLSYNSPLTYDESMNMNTFEYQFKGEPRKASTYSAYLLSEWRPTAKLRFIGAIRMDKFDINKNYFVNYEIASTFRLNKNNLLRYVYSVANKSPFFLDTYLNTDMETTINYYDENTNTIAPIPAYISIQGQEDLKYPTISNHELCWRTKFNSNTSLDLELFYSKVRNFVNANLYRQYEVIQQLNPESGTDSLISIDVDGQVLFENYDLTANQFGVGFTFNYDFSNKLNAKLYGTYQTTKISGRKDIDFVTTGIQLSPVTSDNILKVKVNTTMNPTQWNEALTPSFYGGFLLNYRPGKNWNLSTDGYFYSDQKFTYYNYYKLGNESSIENAKVQANINTNIILNAKASYKISSNLSSYITLRNTLGKHYEYGFADQLGSLVLIGIQWGL